MATFLAHITVKDGGSRDFEAAAAELQRLTLEREEGVIRYEYWRGGEPRHYYTMAVFRDAHAFIEHQVSEHHVRIAGGTIMDLAEQVRLEWLDPVPGTDAPTTAQQPLAPDADAATRDYYERFPVVEGQWWGVDG